MKYKYERCTDRREMIGSGEVCRMLGIHSNTLLSYIAQGFIPAVKMHGRWKFLKQDIIKRQQIGIQ